MGDSCPTPSGAAPNYGSPQGGYTAPGRATTAPAAPYGDAAPKYGPVSNYNAVPNYGAPAAATNATNPVRSASAVETDDRYGTLATAGAGSPASTVADARGAVGSAAGSLPPTGTPYTPGAGSAFNQPASTPYTPGAGSAYSQPAATAPKAATPYPATGTAPANSDAGEPAYRPGSTRTSGDLLPRGAGGLTSGMPGSTAGGSTVVPAGYDRPANVRY